MVADFHIVERNLREAMGIYSLATPQGQIREMPGVTLVNSGLPLAVFNAAMLSTPVPGPEGDLHRRLTLAQVYFKQRSVPWSFWLCEELLDQSAQRTVREVLRHFRVTAEPAGMIADGLLPPSRPLPPLDCHPVVDESSRLAFSEITSVVFELAFPTSWQIYGSDEVWAGRFRGFVGFWQGKPVSTVALWLADDAIGVYSVGTLPQHQHQGFAETLLRFALAWSFRETRMQRTVLQSTKRGFPLYERMGFRAVSQFSVYIAPPA